MNMSSCNPSDCPLVPEAQFAEGTQILSPTFCRPIRVGDVETGEETIFFSSSEINKFVDLPFYGDVLLDQFVSAWVRFPRISGVSPPFGNALAWYRARLGSFADRGLPLDKGLRAFTIQKIHRVCTLIETKKQVKIDKTKIDVFCRLLLIEAACCAYVHLFRSGEALKKCGPLLRVDPRMYELAYYNIDPLTAPIPGFLDLEVDTLLVLQTWRETHRSLVRMMKDSYGTLETVAKLGPHVHGMDGKTNRLKRYLEFEIFHGLDAQIKAFDDGTHLRVAFQQAGSPIIAEQQAGVLDGLKKLMSALGDPGSVREAAQEEIMTVLESIPLFRVGNSVAAAGEGLWSLLLRMFNAIKDSLPVLVPIFLAVVAALFSFYQNKSWARALLILGAGAAAAGFSHMWNFVDLSALLPLLSSESEEEESDVIIAEEQTFDVGLLQKIADVLSTMLVGFRIYCSKSTLFEGLSKLSAVQNGVKAFVKTLFELIISIGSHVKPDLVSSVLGPLFAPVAVQDWLRDVQAFLVADTMGSLAYVEATLTRMKNLVTLGEDFILQSKKMGTEISNPMVLSVLARLKAKAIELGPKFTSKGSTRPRPVVCVLIGDTGVGKTNAIAKLAKCLAMYELRDDQKEFDLLLEDDSSRIYWQGADKYNDTMSYKTLVYLDDDWYQENPTMAKDVSPGMMFAQLAGDQRYNPRMAAVEKKNTVSAGFPYMLMSSNIAKIADSTIIKPQAVARRIDFAFRTELKEGVDFKTLKGFDHTVYRFFRQKVGDNLTFADTGDEEWSFSDVFFACTDLKTRYYRYWEASMRSELPLFQELMSQKQDQATTLVTDILDEHDHDMDHDSDFDIGDMAVHIDEAPVVYYSNRAPLNVQYDQVTRMFEMPESTVVAEELRETLGVPLFAEEQAPGDLPTLTSRAAAIVLNNMQETGDYSGFAAVADHLVGPAGPGGVLWILPSALRRAGEVNLDAWLRGDQVLSFNDVMARKMIRRTVLETLTTHEGVWALVHGVCNDWKAVWEKLCRFNVRLKDSTVEQFYRIVRRVPPERLGVTFPRFDFGSPEDWDPLHLLPFFQSLYARTIRDIRNWLRNPNVQLVLSLMAVALFTPLFTMLGIHFAARVLPNFFHTQPKSKAVPVELPVPVQLPHEAVRPPIAKEEASGFWKMKNPKDKNRDQRISSARDAKQAARMFFNEEQAADVEQGGMADAEIVNLIRPNLYEVWVNTIEKHCQGTALLIQERCMMMPAHFFVNLFQWWDRYGRDEKSPQSGYFTFKNVVTGVEIQTHFSEIRKLYMDDDSNRDLFIFENLAMKDYGKSILKHVAPRQVFETSLFAASRFFSGLIIGRGAPLAFEQGFGSVRVYMPETGTERRDLLSYPVKTMKGDCGKVLILKNSRHSGYILGLHVLGNGTIGHSTPFDREFLVSVLRTGTPAEDLPALEEAIAEIVADETPFEIQADYHGDVEADYCTRQLTVPTGVFGKPLHCRWNGDGPEYFERLLEVADTSPKWYALNRAKFGRVEVTADLSFLPHIRSSLVTNFRRHAPGVKMRNYTLSEAIRGIDDSYIHPIDVHTSPGHPDSGYGIMRTDYFTRDEQGNTVLGPEFPHLTREIANYMNAIGAGAIPVVLFKTIAKGEKLKKQKVEDHTFRFVDAPPIAFHLLVIMYFGAATQVVKTGLIRNGCIGGINEKNAEEWTEFVAHMRSFGGGKNCGSADFSGFDKHNARVMVCHSLQTLADLYPPDDIVGAKMRQGIIQIVSEPYHVFGNVVERRHDGLASGFRLTYEVNSITNLSLQLYAWLKLHDGNLESLPRFYVNVAPIVCGDDLLFSVTDTYRNGFTCRFLAKCVEDFGHVMTAPDKGEPAAANSPLEEHTILKRGFRIEPSLGRWVAPLELNVVLEIPLWTKPGEEAAHVAVDNMNTAVRELSLHGREVFEFWLPKLRAFAGKYWDPISEDFDVVLRMVAVE